MSDFAPQCTNPQDTLSYELLLNKFPGEEDGAGPTCSRLSCDDASTITPESPSTCSVAEGLDHSSHEGPIAAHSAALPRVPKDDTVVLHNVSIHGPGLDSKLQGLIQEASGLSEDVFSEDCLKDCTKKLKWQLTLLASNDFVKLYGFMVAKVTNGCLSIAKLAVVPEFRKFGLGRHFMDEVMKVAKRRGDVYEVCVSSRSTAVTFYQRLGFKAFRGIKLVVDFEVEEGQVYMEKRLRQRPRKK